MKITEPLRAVSSRIINLHGEGYHLNKHIFWVLPVGVAAGIALPLLIPQPERPAPPPAPAAPRAFSEIIVQAHALGARTLVAASRHKVSTQASTTPVLVAQPLSPRVSHPRYHRMPSRLGDRELRVAEFQDHRAWLEAARMLADERAGA